MAPHANGKSQYAIWKEQVRSLPIYSAKKLRAVVDYMRCQALRKQRPAGNTMQQPPVRVLAGNDAFHIRGILWIQKPRGGNPEEPS